ncbi:Nucleotidyltransferase family protein [Balamuthia mandrillaris]
MQPSSSESGERGEEGTWSASSSAPPSTRDGHAGSSGSGRNKQKIYACGKMMFYTHPTRDWRGLLRFKELVLEPGEDRATKLQHFHDLELDLDENWVYCGPFFFNPASQPELEEHVCDFFYGGDDLAAMEDPAAVASLSPMQREFNVEEREREQIFLNLRHQIAKCDVVYARLPGDPRECPFAYAEIGMAAALGKRVYVDNVLGAGESYDSWLVGLLGKATGITHQEYCSIPWALFK